MSRQDSWKNQYHAVEEFELPLERDRMLPSSSPPPPPPPVAGVMSTSSSSTSSSSNPHAQQQQGFPPSAAQPRRNSRSFPSSPLNPQGTSLPSGSSTTHSTGTGRPSTSSGGSHTMHDPSKPLPRSPNSQSTLTAAAAAASSSSTSPTPMPNSPFGRPGSRGSFTFSNTARSPSTLGMGGTPSSPMGGSGLSGTQTPTSELLAAHHSFGGHALPRAGSRGSMILYRRADSGLFSPPLAPGGFVGLGGGSGTTTPVQYPNHTGVSGTSGISEDAPSHAGLLPPPALFSNNRASVYSTSGDSMYGTERGLVPYAYDPDEDESDDEEGDWLHDPAVAYPGSKGGSSAAAAAAGATAVKGKGKPHPRPGVDPTTGQKITDPSHPLYIPQPYIAPRISWRGLINIGTLVAMVASLLCLFVVYPMVRFYADDGINARITGNLRINSTGQAEYFPGDEGVEEDGATPTTTRPPRTTVTSLNEGGNIHDRREASTGILGILERAIVGSPLDVSERGVEAKREVWKREVDDWAVEFPVPSYNLKFFGSEEKVVDVVEAVVDAVEEPVDAEKLQEEGEKSVVKQVVHLCLPSSSIQKATQAQTQDELVARVEFVVGEGEQEEVVGGWYQNAEWTFFPQPLPSASAAAEEEESDDGWTLVKKQTSDSPSTRLSLTLLRSSASDREVTVGRVEVFSPAESVSGWVDARFAGEDGRCGGDDQQGLEVQVDVEDVLKIVQGRPSSS